MKIILLTTYPDAPEVGRLKEESVLMGHNLEVVDFSNFGYSIIDNKITLTGFSSIDDADLVIVRGVFLAIKSLSPLVDYLHKRNIKVFDNQLSVHKYAINKIADFAKLSLAGLPMPDTHYARIFDDFKKNAMSLGYPVVLKSIRVGKGASVVKIDSEQDLEKYIEEQKAEGKDAKDLIMQEFIDYEFDLRIFVLGEKMFCMRRIPPADDFRANFSLGGEVEIYPLNDRIRQLSSEAMKAVDLNVSGVDILLDKDDNAYILEVNHTPGMAGIEKATNENISKMYLEYAIKHAK